MFINIFSRNLSESEALSVNLSTQSIPDIIKIALHSNYPPLWNIIEHFSFQIFGVGGNVARSLSFAFFLVILFFIYKIGTLFFSRKTAVITTFLTLLNPYMFRFAFEGQSYTTLTAGVTASMYFFAKSFFGEGGKWVRFGYIVSTLLSLYTHQMTILVLFVQLFWWIFEILFGRRKTAVKILKCFLIIILLYAPWLYVIYIQTKTLNSVVEITPRLFDIKNLIYGYLAVGIKSDGLKISFINIELSQISLNLVFAILILRRWWKSIKKTIFLILWFLGPISIVFLLPKKLITVMESQYLIYLIPGVMVILASARSKISLIAIILLLLCFTAVDYQYLIHP